MRSRGKRGEVEVVEHGEHPAAGRGMRAGDRDDEELVGEVEAVGRLVEKEVAGAGVVGAAASWTKARARWTRCCSPPESVVQSRSAKSRRPTRRAPPRPACRHGARDDARRPEPHHLVDPEGEADGRPTATAQRAAAASSAGAGGDVALVRARPLPDEPAAAGQRLRAASTCRRRWGRPATVTSPGASARSTRSMSTCRAPPHVTPLAAIHATSAVEIARRRSSSHSMNGAAEDGGDDAERQLGRRGDGAGEDSRRAISRPRRQGRDRQQKRWPGPSVSRSRCGTMRPKKAMTPADGDGGADAGGDAEHRGALHPLHGDAEIVRHPPRQARARRGRGR